MVSLTDRKTRAAAISVASNTLLIVFKLIVGVLIGSVAVISEAIHSGIDLVAAIIALFAVRVAGHEADERHPYGHGKIENISGTVEALLIFAAAAAIIYEAVHRLLNLQPVETPGWGVGVMLVSAIANLFVSRNLFKVGKETDSVALQADAWHLRTDVYTSAGVTVGLLVIWIADLVSPNLNLRWLDPVVAILVALMIVRAAWNLTREAARDLLDASLPDEDIGWIFAYVTRNWPAVRSLHHMRTRKAGSKRFIDFHLVVDEQMPVGTVHSMGDEIEAAIEQRLPDTEVQIHVEPCDAECEDLCARGCVLEPSQREARQTEHERPRQQRGS